MFKKVMIILMSLPALAMLCVAGLAMTKPPSFRIERQIVIQAPPEKIYALLNDFHNWKSWSPFETDPHLQRSFSGPQQGKGAVYTWTSTEPNQGRMEIIEAQAPSKLGVKLNFIKPMEAKNTAEFILTNQRQATKVTWAMFGENKFIGKVMSVFFDIDQVLGKEFEKGLSNLKNLSEKTAQAKKQSKT